MQQINRLFTSVTVLAVLALVAGCGQLPAPTATPVAPAATATVPAAAAPALAAPTSTLPPVVPTNTLAAAATATPRPAATPSPIVTPASALATQLTNLVKPALPTPPATPGPGNLSVGVAPLQSSLGDFWIAYSVGMASFQPVYKHFIAIYSYSGGAFQQIARADLQCAQYLDNNSIKQVQIEASHVWIEVDGAAGAHGGCFDLYSFDGKSLVDQVNQQSPSPGMGSVGDLLGNGTNEVVLDQSEPYVFCYACGVKFAKFKVLRWDGKAFAEVKPTALPDTAPANLRDLNNQAVKYAQANLWQAALQSIDQAMALKSQDQTVAWNVALIHLTGVAQAKDTDGFPLLGDVFMGDYQLALNVMRQYQPQDLFGKTPAIITGTAKGWETSITQWITQTAPLQLTAMPNLAGAYFMLSWGINLTNPASPDVLADMQKAAQLAPNDSLITQSLAYLKTR